MHTCVNRMSRKHVFLLQENCFKNKTVEKLKCLHKDRVLTQTNKQKIKMNCKK